MTVFQSQLFKTTSTVIQTRDAVIIVDPTWLPQEIKEIKDYVNDMKQGKSLYLIFTHSDWDHIIGYGAFPEATVIASEGLLSKKEPEQILEQIYSFDHQYYIDRDYPITYPQVDMVVREDGQKMVIGDTTLTFYKAEGHTDDGIFTIVEPQGIWIAGDYLSDVEFPYIYDSSTKYEETLLKCEEILNKHKISILVPGHGNVALHYEEIHKRKESSFTYIRELRSAIQKGETSQHLIEKYAYPLGMKSFHKANINLIKKEMRIDNN